MKRQNISLLLVCIVALISTDCGGQDAMLRQTIAGEWRSDDIGSYSLLLATNGYFDAEIGQKGTAAGTWQIKDGLLVMTYTRSNFIPISCVNSCKIIRVDDHILTYTDNTKTNSLHR
jgi:hypothetical protein